MAPKKKGEAPVQKRIFGRFSNSLKMGIVGLPNVGKSSFFNALANLSVPAENYPFCTIEPSEARVTVKDERFDWLVDHFSPASRVPAFLEVWDIAGLVKGASEGHGLGNNFLSNIQAVDGLYHVCRAFPDDDVIHVEGSVDPVRDLDIIANELRLKDLERIEKIEADLLARVTREGGKAPKELLFEYETVKKCSALLRDAKKPVRAGAWSSAEIEALNGFYFLTAKPAVYLVNLSEKDYARKKNKWLPKIKAWIDEHTGEPLIPISVAMESKLQDIAANESPEALAAYLEANSVTSALDKVILGGYKALQLIYFFTAGADEVKSWTIRNGLLAPQAAGTIHSDFERGFICAEIMSFDDLKELKTEAAVKAAGKYKQQGKNYTVADGDIIFFKFNVTGAGKKK
ncbi:hypothetical protein MMPV_002631 [Pyropia vietnamensis]